MQKNVKGFTLLELLIVITILGVLAGLMFPVLSAQVEKSHSQEALTALGTVKEAEVKYFSQYSTYTNAWTGAGGIGYNPNAGAAGQTPYFTYSLASGSATTFTCTATKSTGTAGADSISIDQAGTIVKGSTYA